MDVQLIFIGAPGSGKGTQAKLFCQEKGYRHISTGDLLREEVKKNGDLGERINKILQDGKLVTDDIVIDLLSANCNFKSGRYIFDGFPRNLEQTQILHTKLLKGVPYKVFYFKMDHSKLFKRLESRRVCSSCNAIYNLITNPPAKLEVCDHCVDGALIQRDDDTGSVIENRLEVFNKTMKDVILYYKNKGTLVEIDAEKEVAVIYNEMCKQLDLK